MVLVKMLPDGSVTDDRSETTHTLDGPYAAMSAESIRRWALEIAEMRPMLDLRDPGASLPMFVFHLGVAVLALPLALHQAFRGPLERRREWAYLAAVGLVFVQCNWLGQVVDGHALFERLVDFLGNRGHFLAGAAIHDAYAAGAEAQR